MILRVAFPNDGEVPKLKPKDEARLPKKLREIDDAEQYALVARSDGFYTCLNGPPTYFLKAGEVWKYGITTKGELGRFKAGFLFRNNVTYTVQFRGNVAECLKQEQIKLFMYPYLPDDVTTSLAMSKTAKDNILYRVERRGMVFPNTFFPLEFDLESCR